MIGRDLRRACSTRRKRRIYTWRTSEASFDFNISLLPLLLSPFSIFYFPSKLQNHTTARSFSTSSHVLETIEICYFLFTCKTIDYVILDRCSICKEGNSCLAARETQIVHALSLIIKSCTDSIDIITRNRIFVRRTDTRGAFVCMWDVCV